MESSDITRKLTAAHGGETPSSIRPGTRYQKPGTLLVGRHEELEQLYRGWAKASRGERQIVFVSGEPGIGKTALVDAFVERLRGRPEVRIASGQCVEQYGAGEAYLPLLEVTAHLCQGPSRERRIEALKRYAPSLLLQLPGLLDLADHAILQRRVQETSRERMLRELAQAAELFTVQRGLVIVLEDLHWSDVATLDWVRYTAQRREPAKLMIIGTYRPMDVIATNHPLRSVVQELQARQQCEEIHLTPFAQDEVADYLRRRFVGEETDQLPLSELALLLQQRTGGNPLFLVTTVDYLIEQQIVTDEAGRWSIHADKLRESNHDIPDTLRQLIERQLERLREEDQRVLEVASVVGMEFSVAAVAVGLPGSIETLELQCERLAQTGQFLRSVAVEEWPDGTLSGRYSFLHAVYQEVISSRVGEARRIQLSRRVAERKETAYGDRSREVAAELAIYFERGREPAKAMLYCRQAGEAAARSGAPQEALRHLKRGLELLTLLPDTPERMQHEVRLLLALTNPLYAIGGKTSLDEMESAYRRAHELCKGLGEPPHLASVLFGLGMVYELRGDLQKALALIEQLLALAQKKQNPALLLRAHMALGNGLYFLGEFSLSRLHLEQGLAIYNPDKHSPRVSNVAQDLGVVCYSRASWVLWCLGYPDQARDSSDRGLTLARELSHNLSEAFALDGAIGIAQECGDLSTVDQRVARLMTLSHDQGFPYPYAWGTMVHGWLLVKQGKTEEGIAQLHQGLTTIRMGGQELGISYFMGLLAEAYGTAGRIEEGLTVVTEALTIGQRYRERFYEAELCRLKGELTLVGAQGWGTGAKEEERSRFTVQASQFEIADSRPSTPGLLSEAEECFQTALDIARHQQAKSLELRAAMSLARLWQSQGKDGDARELLQGVYDWFTEGFDTRDLQDAKALLVMLGGSVEAGEESQKSKITDLRPLTPDAQPSVLSPQSLSVFRSEGEYWTVVFQGMTARIKDTRGMQYLAHLLQHANQDIAALALASDSPDPEANPFAAASLTGEHRDPVFATVHVSGLTDAGEVLDPQAKAEYRQRLKEIQAELEEAREFNDVDRIERLQAELEFITQELVGAVGLRGRARKAASPQERARVNVTRAIRTAITRVVEVHPVLGQYLTQTIKTGTFCAYVPNPHSPVIWEF